MAEGAHRGEGRDRTCRVDHNELGPQAQCWGSFSSIPYASKSSRTFSKSRQLCQACSTLDTSSAASFAACHSALRLESLERSRSCLPP